MTKKDFKSLAEEIIHIFRDGMDLENKTVNLMRRNLELILRKNILL
ncbi:MAG: hypothetical protein AABY22_32810 [Nanoarchaeota archaeon]